MEQPKKTNRKKSTPDRLKVLVCVVGQKDGEKINEICNRECGTLTYTFEGSGTARSAMLDYFGLGEQTKRILVSLIPESYEKNILADILAEMSLYLVGKGICFTLPLSAVSSIVADRLTANKNKDGQRRKTMTSEDRTHELIVVAVQQGYAEEAMESARKVGAMGGTLINAKTLGNRKAEQLIGVTLQEETELLLIITKKDKKKEIMQAVQQSSGLKTDAGGILFSLPVDNLIGVGNRTAQLDK